MIEKFWDMAFVFGAIGGALHNPMIEGGKDCYMRLVTYGFSFFVGWCFFMFAGTQCELGNCNSHPIWVGSYLVGSFFMGLGGTGFMVNFSQRGTKDDPDMQMQMPGMMNQMPVGGPGLPGGPAGISMPMQNAPRPVYEPVTPQQQGPML